MPLCSEARCVKCPLPHLELPGADWGDCFEINVLDHKLTAIDAARLTLGRIPGWIRLLMRMRNGVASLFGLKPAPDETLSADRQIGSFPVISQSVNRVVLGLDDRHLDFRIIIDVRDNFKGGTIVASTTLVKRKNRLGRVYLRIVKPFHKLIVPAVLVQALEG
jgi:Protein of unknown function (DUF2867)